MVPGQCPDKNRRRPRVRSSAKTSHFLCLSPKIKKKESNLTTQLAYFNGRIIPCGGIGLGSIPSAGSTHYGIFLLLRGACFLLLFLIKGNTFWFREREREREERGNGVWSRYFLVALFYLCDKWLNALKIHSRESILEDGYALWRWLRNNAWLEYGIASGE